MENAVEIFPEGNDQKAVNVEISFLGFLLRGLIFSCFSISFYKRAIQKHPFWAIGFFAVFGFLSSAVIAITFIIASNGSRQAIIDDYDAGITPTIVIENGIASVEGMQPWISEQGELVLIVDTTGKITEIDDEIYENGILLTKYEIHFLINSDYTIHEAKELHELFGDPIIIDKQVILFQWSLLNLFIGLIVFSIFFVWFVIIRFMTLMGIALIVWGILSIFKKGVQYNTVLTIGLLANVPAVYINSVLIELGIFFLPMHTLLMLGVWSIMLVMALKGMKVRLSVIAS